jgi:hypothetical protein
MDVDAVRRRRIARCAGAVALALVASLTALGATRAGAERGLPLRTVASVP